MTEQPPKPPTKAEIARGFEERTPHGYGNEEATDILDRAELSERLTGRQYHIYLKRQEGYTQLEIAQIFRLSERTVRNECAAILVAYAEIDAARTEGKVRTRIDIERGGEVADVENTPLKEALRRLGRRMRE